jgi:8-oxo-dGTP pyrophosphatase MutT (NUDIX family)
VSRPRIVALSRVDARLDQRLWPWASDHRAVIDAHWRKLTAGKPDLYNGRVLMLRHKRIAAGILTARYFETDYASFIAWRDLGHPDPSVGNGFAMAALRSADGAWLLGIMGEHTANAGRIYFPAGTPDPGDLTAAGEVDLAGSVRRELAEETGLTESDVTFAESWTAVIDEPRTALMRETRSALAADALQARIHTWLARQRRPELAAMHVVRSPRDLDQARMPSFTLAFLCHKFEHG